MYKIDSAINIWLNWFTPQENFLRIIRGQSWKVFTRNVIGVIYVKMERIWFIGMRNIEGVIIFVG